MIMMIIIMIYHDHDDHHNDENQLIKISHAAAICTHYLHNQRQRKVHGTAMLSTTKIMMIFPHFISSDIYSFDILWAFFVYPSDVLWIFFRYSSDILRICYQSEISSMGDKEMVQQSLSLSQPSAVQTFPAYKDLAQVCRKH